MGLKAKSKREAAKLSSKAGRIMRPAPTRDHESRFARVLDMQSIGVTLVSRQSRPDLDVRIRAFRGDD